MRSARSARPRGEWQCAWCAQGRVEVWFTLPLDVERTGRNAQGRVAVREVRPGPSGSGAGALGRPLGLWAPHRHRDAPLSLPETTLSRRKISPCRQGHLISLQQGGIAGKGPVADRGTRCRQGAFPAGQAACPASHKRRDRTRYGVGTAPAPYERVGMPARPLPASPSR